MAHKKHHKEEKSCNYGLLIFSVLAVVVCIALLIGFYIYLTNDSEPTSSSQSSVKNVCNSPECFQLAHQMHNFGNKSVDPCVNFYEYTCGRYAEHVATENAISRKNTIIENMIGEYLHRNRVVLTDSKSETIMKQFYNWCSAYTDLGNPLYTLSAFHQEVLANIEKVGPWPMLDPSFNESKFDLGQYLENMAGKLNLVNFGLFRIRINAFINIENDREAYSMSSFKKSELTTRLYLIMQGANKKFDEKTFAKDLADVYQLHQNLSDLGFSSFSNFNLLDFPDFVSVNLRHMNFEKILKNLLSPKHPEYLEDVKKDIWVSPLLYTKKEKLHQLIQSTPPRTMANFLLLRTFQVLFDMVDYKPLQKCSTAVVDLMPQAALRVYVQNYFDKANLKSGADLAEKIKEAFLTMFRNSNWLHQETKDNAIRKIEKMRTIIGYPNELEAPGSLDKQYEELIDVSPNDTFLELNRKLRVFNTRSKVMEFRRMYIFAEQPTAQANAYYNKKYNLFVMCIPFLDEPFFAASLPEIAKLAMVGFIIGHEIGHGFDNSGIHLDGDSNETNWWNSDDMSEYVRRYQCLIDQYDNHDDPSFGKNLKGGNVLMENIPDIHGAKTAWIAYKKSVVDQPSIIGFEHYTPDKLFFHLRALLLCSAYNTKTLNDQLRDPHGVNNFRVNGVNANLKEFAEAFQCPLGSPMNPEKKCELF